MAEQLRMVEVEVPTDFDAEHTPQRRVRYIRVYGGERRFEIVATGPTNENAVDILASEVVPEGAPRYEYLRRALDQTRGPRLSDYEVGAVWGRISERLDG